MSKKPLDPFFEREQAKYELPIPSRELILQTLGDFGRPMTRTALIKSLSIDNPAEQEALGFRLKAMARDGQIMFDRKNRLCLLDRVHLLRGRIQSHPDGYGFFIPDNDTDDLLLSTGEMRGVMHGDVVLVYPVGIGKRGRPEAKVHEIIEHANTQIVGRFFIEHGMGFVVPDNKRLTQDVTILPQDFNNALSGQIVLVEIISFPTRRQPPIGRITQILGEHMAPGMEINIAIHAHQLPDPFPEEVLQAASAVPATVSEADCAGRSDLRHLDFVTIDGEDARDFDDAVYAEQTHKGDYHLFVAIADVSYYVTPDSPLDQEAARRGNSVYFPEKVIPMLPENLSNGICSLNPHVDRLCMVAELTFSPMGLLKRSRIYRAVFQSRARLTYTQVGKWLSDQSPDVDYVALWPMCQTLYALYKILHAARVKRGAIDFDSTETKIVFTPDRKIEQILPVVRNDAHRLIEECMLAANVAVAQFLEKTNLPILYRVHPAPEEEKVATLRQFLKEINLKLGGGRTPSPKDFQKTLSQLAGRPEKKLIELIMLRSLKQAQYIEKNEGHFGLAYSAYTHFTSPIRRYPDLLIHRALTHVLDKAQRVAYPYTEKSISALGQHCSHTERRADEATRDAVAWLKCEYMQDKLGQRFTGTISGITSFGLFVELDRVYVEGLVHISNLKSDYYDFDASNHRLVGSRSGKIYRLGEKIAVIVARVNLEDRKIDFEPAS